MVDNVAEEDDARLAPARRSPTFHRGRGCRPGETSRVAPIDTTSGFPFRPTIRRIYGFVETQPTRSSGASSSRRQRGGGSRTPMPTISPSCPSAEDSLEAQGTRWLLMWSGACRRFPRLRGGGWKPACGTSRRRSWDASRDVSLQGSCVPLMWHETYVEPGFKVNAWF